jgi:hypothetical protein
MTPTGFEEEPDSGGKPQSGVESGAKSGAIKVGPLPDTDLARVLDAWPTLPEPIRRAVLALVETSSQVTPRTPKKLPKKQQR